MTTPLEKPVRRQLKIRGVDYVLELAPAGIMFRRLGARQRCVAPMGEILELALEHMRRTDLRELARLAALRRIGR